MLVFNGGFLPSFFARGKLPLNVADLFSTDLYTGNGSTQTITNGIDLSGEGGLVWGKNRNDTFGSFLVDSSRGIDKRLVTELTNAEVTEANGITAFNVDGFSLGNATVPNFITFTYVAWTFRRAPRFFDVVTYTGNGVAGRTIPHNLGVAPGMIVIKNRSDTSNWQTYHRSLTSASYHIRLNQTDGEIGPSTAQWDGTPPTSSAFTVGTDFGINKSGDTYVAYLFAHDTASDGVIQCGSYTGNGTNNPITLGWEPQWLMVKRTDTTSDWFIVDAARGFPTLTGSGNPTLYPNLSNAETSAGFWYSRSDGFEPFNSTGASYNAVGGTYTYLAVRAEGA